MDILQIDSGSRDSYLEPVSALVIIGSNFDTAYCVLDKASNDLQDIAGMIFYFRSIKILPAYD